MSAPLLTREQAIQLQTRFIEAYSDASFQETLKEEWAKAGADENQKRKVRQKLCLPVQGPLLKEFGFEDTKIGVADAVQAFNAYQHISEVAKNNMQLARLTDPDRKASVAALPKSSDAETAASSAPMKANEGDVAAGSRAEPARRDDRPSPTSNPSTRRTVELTSDNLSPSPNVALDVDEPVWQVVGGQKSGGITVRRSKELKSPELKVKLAFGATVKQVALEGERLHYIRLTGEGPDIGWVSLSFKGTALLERINTGTAP